MDIELPVMVLLKTFSLITIQRVLVAFCHPPHYFLFLETNKIPALRSLLALPLYLYLDVIFFTFNQYQALLRVPTMSCNHCLATSNRCTSVS